MAGTNQIASETWVPQTDKFGNQVNPVWAQNGGTGTPEQVAAYTTQIRDLANRALSTSGAGADAFNFAGYTLPNNKYVQQALQGWTPPETRILDPISGNLARTTQLSYADALAKLGVTPGTTSTYTADKTFAPNDAMAGFTQDQKNALAGSFSDVGNQKNNASYISSSLVNKTIPVTSDASLGNRQYISNVQKPGYIKGYDTNNGYKQVYVPAGKYVPGISMYPKPTNTITPDKMKNETPINVPGTPTNGASPVGAGEASAMIAGGKTAISDLIQQLTPAQTDAEKKQQALLDQMASLAGQEANKAADQLTAEQSANLPQLRQQFAEINGQIMTKSAEYDALVKAQEGKPITMSSIIGSERAILNAKASDIGMLTARAQALQGQIETAQSTVNRSIDLKYSSIDARLNMYQAQLNALQPTLTKEEKIRAQAQQVLLDERKQVLEEQKNTEKQLSSYNIQMMSKYPSAKISITDSYETTQKKVAQSAEYKAQLQQDSLDNQYKKAQIANIQSEIAKRNIEGTGTNFDPVNIAAYAQQYASTGQIPTGLPKGSFGVVAQTAKDLPKPVGTLIDMNTGIKSSKINSTQSDAFSAAYDLINNVIPSLKSAYDNAYTGLLPGALSAVGIRSDDLQHFEDIRSNFLNKLLLANSGKVVSDKELQRYQELLPSAGSNALFLFGRNGTTKLDDIEKSIKDALDSQLKVNGLEIVGYGSNQGNIQKAAQFDDTENPSKPLSMGKNGSESIETIKIGNKPVQVSSVIASPLAMADNDFFEATGKHIQINEALRSIERQAELYQKFKSGQGGRAAPPGKSFHETGKAVDIGNWQEAAPYLHKYGFQNNLPDDRNHFSIGEFS